jgi:hypothetical protein
MLQDNGLYRFGGKDHTLDDYANKIAIQREA